MNPPNKLRLNSCGQEITFKEVSKSGTAASAKTMYVYSYEKSLTKEPGTLVAWSEGEIIKMLHEKIATEI